jgi:hypothetical protein
MISASLIFAAMSDARAGRFYSVDELATSLRVQDRTEFHEQLRMMASFPDLQGSCRLLQGSSDQFYRRVSSAPALTLRGPWETRTS